MLRLYGEYRPKEWCLNSIMQKSKVVLIYRDSTAIDIAI
jgi:hypothetical protein